MHYKTGSSDSSHSYESWTEHNAQPFYGHLSSPVPIPNAPHLRTVSLPVPITNAPHLHTVSLPHPYAGSQQSPMSFQRPSTSHTSLMTLHPLLSHGPNLMFNVTRDLTYVQLRSDCPPTRLQESAVHPPVSRMTIAIFDLPAWSIEVVNPRGITVNDILLKIRELLNRRVASHEMRGPFHAVAVDSFTSRSRADPREHAQGVKRIDFLGPKIFFAGLSRARDGSDRWDLHFSKRV